jgi:gamma-glutamylcyclotransferase (GGCT)/AIG2-like uncharacterized protein YtfP
MIRLFVYGTLQTGGPSNWMLDGFRRLREDSLGGTLYDLGEYPTLVLGGDSLVMGEVWEGPDETLQAIDSYEQVGEGLFSRVSIPLEDGKCWVYVAGPELERRLQPRQIIPGGRWWDPPRSRR